MADSRRSGNPARRASASSGSAGSSERGRGRSAVILVRLTRLPPLVVPGLVLALMLVGLMAPLPVALPALLVIVAFIGWLAVLSWPVLNPRGRLTRVVVLLLVAGSTVARAAGWL